MVNEKNKRGDVFRLGHPNDTFANYFTEQSYLNPLTNKEDYVSISKFTFEPNCRNHWHIHHTIYPAGKILSAVDGIGIYQEYGKTNDYEPWGYY